MDLEKAVLEGTLKEIPWIEILIPPSTTTLTASTASVMSTTTGTAANIFITFVKPRLPNK